MKRTLTSTSTFLALAMSVVGTVSATASRADDTCTFESYDAHYASLTSPAERLSFKWSKSTGKVIDFEWIHGGATWFPFAAERGMVLPDGGFPADYHLRVNLGVTTTGYTSTRYEIRGYINTNLSEPNVTFAGIHEGTGSAWIVAYGELTCR